MDIGNVSDKPRSGRLKTARTEAAIDRVSESVTDEPKTSIRKRSKQLTITQSSLHRILREELKFTGAPST